MYCVFAGWKLTSAPKPKFFQMITSPPKPRKKPLRLGVATQVPPVVMLVLPIGCLLYTS